MSIFTGLFRARGQPQNRTAGSSYAFFMGGSSAGKAVTERTAMQMTAASNQLSILHMVMYVCFCSVALPCPTL